MPKTKPGEARKWLEAHVSYSGDDCLVWPFARSSRQGYGHIGWAENGVKIGKLAHTRMCELAHGSAPSPQHEAAHNCGNGHGGCVNPRHVEWKTKSENQKDRRRHGTAMTSRYGGGTSALSREQWDAIRALKGRMTLVQVAARFGSTVSTVHRIQNRSGYPRRSASNQ